MQAGRNRFYRMMLFFCVLGYLWITLSFLFFSHEHVSVCVIKKITGYACPGCGTTRSLHAFFAGHLYNAFHFNPLGIFFGLCMLFFPVWIFYDFLQKKQTFFICYQRAESILRKPIAILIILVLTILNWMWNIQKSI